MPEELCLARAQHGDADAFEALLAPYEGRIYAVCLRMMGNREDAQDSAQDTMIRIYRALPEYRGQSALSTWIYRVATNTCLDALRKRKARPGISLEALIDDGFSPADMGDVPETAYDARERKEALHRCIAELPEEMRVAFILRDLQGLSYEAVVEATGAQLGTVKSRISRAREKIRETLRQVPELFGQSRVSMHERRMEG